MLKEENLLEEIEKENLYAFKVDTDLDKFNFLKSESIYDLFKFAKVNHINSIFYEYMYYDKEKYIFDLEEVKLDLDEDIFKIIKKDLINHNKKIDTLNFLMPMSVAIYVMYQGEKIGIMQVNLWLEEYDDILEADEKLDMIMDNYSDILLEKKEKEVKKLDNLKVEFENFLLNDEEFLECTNQNMRKYYMKSVFNKVEAEKYKPAFMTINRFGDRLLDNSSLFMCIEAAWRKYKNKK